MNLDGWKGEAARVALGDPTAFYDAFDAEYTKVMELAARIGTVGTAETFQTATRAGIAGAITASIERAAPLIAEQVLRSAVDALRPIAQQYERDGDVFALEFAAGIREAMEQIGRSGVSE